jgi:cytochrome c oxidase subunit 2
MSTEEARIRADRRAAGIAARREERLHAEAAVLQVAQRGRRVRATAFAVIVVAVLAAGVYLAAGDLFGQRGTASTAGATSVRLSMAGFTPSEIKVPAGKPVSLELWTTDAAPHLQGGVHTMINDQLGLHFELPAASATGESREVVNFIAPSQPGTYDIYCNTCCGGKDSPTMHGKLTVTA